MDYLNSQNRIYGEISWKMIPQDPFDFHKGLKVAIQTPLGISYMDYAQGFLATRSELRNRSSPYPTYGNPMPNITRWPRSIPPRKLHGPTSPTPHPSPPPGPRESFSAPLDIRLLLLSLARSIGFFELKGSVESLFDQFDDGETSAQSFPRPKYAEDGLYSRPGQRRNSEIIARLQGLADEVKFSGDHVQNLRDDFRRRLGKAQNQTSEEFPDFEFDVKNEFQVGNQLQPLTNPNEEDFIPQPKPQVPFRQVEPSTPGKDLGVTVEQTGPGGESIVITLHGKAYSDTDTGVPQGPPVSELGAKGPKGPRPGQPTYPPQGPKPDRTPPEKPKPTPKPKP